MYQQKLGTFRKLKPIYVNTGELVPITTDKALLDHWAKYFCIRLCGGHDAIDVTKVYMFRPDRDMYLRPRILSQVRRRLYHSSPSPVLEQGTYIHRQAPIDVDIHRYTHALDGKGVVLARPSSATSLKVGVKELHRCSAVTIRRLPSVGNRFRVVRSDSYIFNDDGQSVMVADVTENEILHCSDCDVSENGTVPDGNPSMRSFKNKLSDLTFYCFVCRETTVIQYEIDYVGFSEEDRDRGGNGEHCYDRLHVVSDQQQYLSVNDVIAGIQPQIDSFFRPKVVWRDG